MQASELYYELRELYSIKDIADKLNLHYCTLKRWESLKKCHQTTCTT